MPSPTISDVHINEVLTGISVAYAMRTEDFIADKVFPMVSVQKQSDTYWTYPRDAWFRDEAKERAPGTPSVGGGWTLSTDTYYARKYAFHVDLDDDTIANADSVLNLERDATTMVTNRLLLKRETLFITQFFGTSIWTKDVTGVATVPSTNQVLQWNDANSTPVEDVDAWKLYMKELTGFMPNVLVAGPRVVQQLKQHPDIIDRIKYTQRGFITEDMLAGLLGVDKLLIPYGIKNTANEGATAAYSFLYGKSALLAYSAPSPGVRQATAGYIFPWTGLLGSGSYGNRMLRFRMPEIQSDRIEGEMAFDMKVVCPELGVFFSALVA